MEYRKLGRSDLSVSVICLGTMTWGEQNNQQQAFEQIEYALSQGVNFFDTAELYAVPPRQETYGRTESIIGEWLKANPSCRSDIVIASKIAGPGFPWIRDGQVMTPASIRQALEGSLQRLQTDYIDLYQLHWPNRSAYHFGRHHFYHESFAMRQTPGLLAQEGDLMLENVRCLDELVKEGKIRHYGLSNETAWGVMRYMQLCGEHALPRMVSIQNEYNLLCRFFEKDLAEVALFEDIGLLAWSPLACGALSGKYLNGQMPAGTRRTLLNGPSHRDNPSSDRAIINYMTLADKHGLDICQMALAFVRQQPFTTSVIIGATTMEQLRNNIASVEVTLSQTLLSQIQTAYHDCAAPF